MLNNEDRVNLGLALNNINSMEDYNEFVGLVNCIVEDTTDGPDKHQGKKRADCRSSCKMIEILFFHRYHPGSGPGR